MNNPTRHYVYQPGTKCHVPGCEALAEFEVYLYDYYPYEDSEFFEQDFTCPFLCGPHMEQNEREGRGERRPRGMVYYPFTNLYHGLGYSKYAPLSEVFPLLYSATTLAQGRLIVSSIEEINGELISYLARHPELMYDLNPRKFEELVAALLQNQGFSPTVTPKTRDGGKDIIATRSDAFGEHIYLVECKRYAPDKKVGVQQVRSIHGVARSEGATKGILVTTSSFTANAIEFAMPHKYDLMLADFEVLKKWIVDAAIKA
jgi:hypothetical protein